MKTINDYLPSHLIACKGNCPCCGKELGEDDSIFFCKECIRKDTEYREQSKIQEAHESCTKSKRAQALPVKRKYDSG